MTISGYVPSSGEKRPEFLARAIRDAMSNGASQSEVDSIQTDITTLQLRPSFLATKNGTNQTPISAATFTKITFTTEDWDTGSHYDAANSKLIPTLAGKWYVSANVRFSTTNIIDQGQFVLSFYKNGSLYKNGLVLSISGTSASPSAHGGVEVDMNGTTDYVEIYSYMDGSGNLTVLGHVPSTFFSAHYVGP